MRVLMINRADAFENLGGDTIQMTQTADALKRAGINVEVATGVQSAQHMREFDVVHIFNLQTPDFSLSQLEVAKSANKKVAFSTIWWDFEADEILRQSFAMRRVRTLLGTRVTKQLIQARVNPSLRRQRVAHVKILQEADVLLPNSESEVDQLHKLGRFSSPTVVVPNAADYDAPEDHEGAAELMRAHGLHAQNFILIAARVEITKNQLRYIKAVSAIGMPVVCAGTIRDGYADYCREAGAILLGRVERPILSALMRQAKLHALPSYRETPGLASLEAAAAGLPIVSTNVGSAFDYFEEMAFYCDPHDPRSMLRATTGAINAGRNPKLENHIRTHFTWDKAAEATLKAYRMVL